MSYLDVVKSIPGLKAYYPLNDQFQAKDAVGTLHGTSSDVAFAANGATFDGNDYIELPSSSVYSPAATGQLSVLAFQTVTNWQANTQGGEYVHWMGKGEPGTHEWVFRYYPGDHATRPKRTSFYCFNAAGGLGAGSYFQDNDSTTIERVIVGQMDRTNIEMWKNGVRRDVDPLSGYNITLKTTTARARIGTRDKTTGYMVGRIRRVAFFNRKLTTDEIKKLYDERGQAEGTTTTARTHLVKTEDTLSGIASTYGVSTDSIVSLNKLIYPGQVLNIPPA